MPKLKLSTILKRLGACGEARNWARSQSDPQSAWDNCKRSDWMIWIFARSKVDQDSPLFISMACDFAESVLHLVPPGEDRPRIAIELARKFITGDATREEMTAAGDAARAAAGDAARAAAWVAARAAAGDAARAAARDAAWVAARDAARAAARDAAWAAAGDAARDAAWVAAWVAAWAAQSDIIRKYFPTYPKIKFK